MPYEVQLRIVEILAGFVIGMYIGELAFIMTVHWEMWMYRTRVIEPWKRVTTHWVEEVEKEEDYSAEEWIRRQREFKAICAMYGNLDLGARYSTYDYRGHKGVDAMSRRSTWKMLRKLRRKTKLMGVPLKD